MKKPYIIRLRRSLLGPIAWYLSRRELHALMRQAQTPVRIVQAAMDYAGRGFYDSIRPVQRIPEITSLAFVVVQLKPKVVVEIGTHRGGTLFVWVRSNPQLELAVSIDLPGGKFGGGYAGCRIKLYRQFAFDHPCTRMEFLRADSHVPSTLAALRQVLGSRSIDFLYIDGDHTYAGVKKDFEQYSPLVRKGGIIAFHDIVTTGRDHEVHRFWNDIKPAHRHSEFVQDRQGNMGIGVIHA
jgi:cephalosporin hydroxylase